jgi:hypothetical protein
LKPLERRLHSLAHRLAHTKSARGRAALESQIAELERRIAKTRRACAHRHARTPKKGGSTTPNTGSPSTTGPTSTTTPSFSCTGSPPMNGSGSNAGDVEEEDPCTNAPGGLERFTVLANLGPITNFIAPTGFACAVHAEEGTLACAAATPVDASSRLRFVVRVSGARCPGLTLTITDYFVGGASYPFKVSC